MATLYTLGNNAGNSKILNYKLKLMNLRDKLYNARLSLDEPERNLGSNFKIDGFSADLNSIAKYKGIIDENLTILDKIISSIEGDVGVTSNLIGGNYITIGDRNSFF